MLVCSSRVQTKLPVGLKNVVFPVLVRWSLLRGTATLLSGIVVMALMLDIR